MCHLLSVFAGIQHQLPWRCNTIWLKFSVLPWPLPLIFNNLCNPHIQPLLPVQGDGMVSNLPLENLPRSGVLFMVHSICTEYLCIPYGSHQSLRLALHSPTVSTSVILTLVPVVLSFISTISGSLEQVRLDDGIVDIIHPLRVRDLLS